jgi:cytochrome P450
MAHFIDLGISIYDPKFTLDPYRYLAPYYSDKDIIGFTSEGLNFLFKFADCREVMFSKAFGRPARDAKANALEIEYAKTYKARANHFYWNYTHGEPNLKLKSLLVRTVTAIAESVTDEVLDPACKQLDGTGRLDNYITEVSHMPLRLYLDVCGLDYSNDDLIRLHRASCDFLRSFESPLDEEMVALCDKSIDYVDNFIRQSFAKLNKDAALFPFIDEGRRSGVSEDLLTTNLGCVLLISLSNTFGISSAFVLRSLLKRPDAIATLRSSPELLDNENTITEILRVDNHVKALSRAVLDDFQLSNYQFKKGEDVRLFFPGVNMDPQGWGENPQEIIFGREFTQKNNIVFGGSIYMCIGKKLTFAGMKSMLSGFAKYLPESAEIVEDEIEVDGSWLAERIITKMPLKLS